MEIRQFAGNPAQVSWPEEYVAELEALSPTEQLRYFYKDANYAHWNQKCADNGDYGWGNPLCYYNLPVEAVELLDGKIAAVCYEGHRVQLGKRVCTYYASDNNGSGYKERADYASLICGAPIDFPQDFYEVAGDTVTFNANTPTYPYAFMYTAVKPWERDAQTPIRHVVFADDVSYVPKYMLRGMTGLETVRQPAAINRKLVDVPGCQHIIGGIRVPEAFMSWDGDLVRVRESVEEYRVLGDVKKIGAYAFADCPNLKRVIIPENVTEVAEGTFAAFTDSLTIYCEAAEKPEGWAEDLAFAEGVHTPRVVWGYRE